MSWQLVTIVMAAFGGVCGVFGYSLAQSRHEQDRILNGERRPDWDADIH